MQSLCYNFVNFLCGLEKNSAICAAEYLFMFKFLMQFSCYNLYLVIIILGLFLNICKCMYCLWLCCCWQDQLTGHTSVACAAYQNNG
jgi:hypothetical protein